jgi:hypothetical protein
LINDQFASKNAKQELTTEYQNKIAHNQIIQNNKTEQHRKAHKPINQLTSAPYQRVMRYPMPLQETQKELDNLYHYLINGIDELTTIIDNPLTNEDKFKLDSYDMIRERPIQEAKIIKNNLNDIKDNLNEVKKYLNDDKETIDFADNPDIKTMQDRLKACIVQLSNDHPTFPRNQQNNSKLRFKANILIG